MSAFSGYVTYIRFGLGTEKGGVGGRGNADGNHPFFDDGTLNTVVNDPFTLGEMTPSRERYSGATVVETVTENGKVKWGGAGRIGVVDPADGQFKVDHVLVAGSEGPTAIALSSVTAGMEVTYIYDNQYVPQEKLPTLVGRMEGIALTAKARRIAVQYSQFAAFQSKTDYGIDFESTIAQQAQAELAYEIDTEAVMMIKNAADAAVIADPSRKLTWVDEELDTLAYSLKAEGFARKIEQAKAAVYKKTGKHLPNWMLVGPSVMPIITFVPGFQSANPTAVAGPYVAGTVAGMKVIVSPVLDKECYLGLLGADGKTAVGVYAPYMPIVPTQLLGFADGMMSQGFSTLYDMKILNDVLLAKIEITSGNDLAKVEFVQSSEI